MTKLAKIFPMAWLLSWAIFTATFGQEFEVPVHFYQMKSHQWKKCLEQAQKPASQSNFDVMFYHIDVEIAIHKPYIKGNVQCRFKATEPDLQDIQLNLHHILNIDSISGNVNRFTFANDTIYIHLDKTYQKGAEAELRIYYQGEPQPAEGIVGFQYAMIAGAPRITTLSEPYYSHYWWPCKDGAGDKADSVYIDITIPDTTILGAELMATSNGMLENVVSKGGKKTFQWRERYPIATYYIMAAIASYKHFQHSYSDKYGDNFSIDYYVFPENFTIAQGQVSQLPAVMTFFSDLFGKYPFYREKYAMTQIQPAIGLENQTNTILGVSYWGWFPLLVHELSHSWFGCMISFADLRHVWLNEGFATYCEALWTEHVSGTKAYQNYMNNFKYFHGGALCYQEVSKNLFEIFGTIIYSKGAYVLHMLRGVMGDSLFFQSLYQYANHVDLMYQHAQTEELKNVCEKTSGLDLDFFFEQWVYDEYYPKYEYSFYQNDSTLETTVRIEQTQTSHGWRTVFTMPVQLKFIFNDRSDTTIVVWNDQQNQTFSFQLTRPIVVLQLDPSNWILKQAKSKPWVTEVEDVSSNKFPSSYELKQNYPNPFNPLTTIEYDLPRTTFVRLEILNVLGQRIATLVEEKQKAGYFRIAWDGRDSQGKNVPSGVYICLLKAEGYMMTRKMLLLR